MSRRTPRWALLALTLLALPLVAVACDDATAPTVETVWELTQVGDQGMPATIQEAPGTFRTFVSDEIRILSDERWQRIQVQQLDEPAGPDRQFFWETDGTIVEDGDELVLDYVCNDTAACIAPDRLRIGPSSATIEWRVSQDSVITFLYLVRVEQLAN